MTVYPDERNITTEPSCTTLVVAHPGHELRIHGWLETVRPEVWILTNGAGRTNRSRINSTTAVLDAAGAVPGPVYGQMSDADVYNSALSFDHQQFTQLVDRLAEALIRGDVDCVAGDAEEGYNPAHDICRLVINAAIKLVKNTTNKEIGNYDFTLVGPPIGSSDEVCLSSIQLALDDAAFSRKLAAARNYPELRTEVEAALEGSGSDLFKREPELARRIRETFGSTDASHFRTECLRLVNNPRKYSQGLNGDAPFYEAYGERQVKAGHYTRVLRYREHMLPLAMALEAYVERNS